MLDILPVEQQTSELSLLDIFKHYATIMNVWKTLCYNYECFVVCNARILNSLDIVARVDITENFLHSKDIAW